MGKFYTEKKEENSIEIEGDKIEMEVEEESEQTAEMLVDQLS